MNLFIQQIACNFRQLARHIVASELKDPICHSDECQIGSFSFEATTYSMRLSLTKVVNSELVHRGGPSKSQQITPLSDTLSGQIKWVN